MVGITEGVGAEWESGADTGIFRWVGHGKMWGTTRGVMWLGLEGYTPLREMCPSWNIFH